MGIGMIYFPKGEPQESSKSIVLLLPLYLDETFIHFFNLMGLTVIHSYHQEVLEHEVNQLHIDLALEWQHGPEDYLIRDLLRRCEKSVPILLCLNWSGVLSDLSSLGYQDYLKVPWEINELISKFCDALLESKKPILRELWDNCGKKQG
jgi:hypothetical protein